MCERRIRYVSFAKDVEAVLGLERANLLAAGPVCDEIVPAISADMHKRIPGSELVIFEESAHSAHTEEADHYAAVLRDFFRRTEAAA